MARNIISAVFPTTAAYVSDRGTEVESVSFRMGQPSDLADSVINTILNTVGATRRTAADAAVCPVGNVFTPRRLQFLRRDGNSFSVAVRNSQDALTVAAAVQSAVNGASSGNPVVCIRLFGERWDDIRLELAPNRGAVVPGQESRSRTSGKQFQHAGQVFYRYDGGGEAEVSLSVKVDTDVVTAAGVTSPPTILGNVWEQCVGAFQPRIPCPSNSFIEHRRYVATLATSADPTDETLETSFQTTEVPVIRNVANDILACGQNLANQGAAVCVAYYGESNSRLHTFLGSGAPAPTPSPTP